MNERDEIEQLRFEVGQSTMTKDKKDSKTGSHFKYKFKSLKKIPHSASANSAVQKARAFFRSLELKRLNGSHRSSKEQRSPSIDQHTTVNAPCSSSNSILINENIKKNDSVLNSITRTTNISIPRNIKVDKINPKDMIVYRLLDNDHDDDELPLNYFQQKYKQYLKPSLLLPKQYYNDLLNKRYQNYFTSINQHDSGPRAPVRTLNPNLTYSTHIYPPSQYPTKSNETSSHHQISTSLYKNRSIVCRQTESSFLVPSPYDQPAFSIRRSSPSTGLTWNQCVDRLNTEYRSTIKALQQAKEYLEEFHPNPTNSISKSANLVTRGITNLSNNETKKTSNVTFRLPSPTLSDKLSSSRSTNRIEQSKIFPSITFCKPKLVKPIVLDTFSPSSKLESVLSIDEKPDSIADIIKKFNNLNNSIPSTAVKSHINEKAIDSSTAIKLKDISDQSLLSELPLINEEPQSKRHLQDEEITYTIDTFYKSTDDKKNNVSSNDQHLLITREDTTAEQFDLVYQKQHQEIQPKHISSQDTFTLNEIKFPSFNENTPSILLKNNNKFLSQIPKRTATTTMHATRLKQPLKLSSFSNKLKPLSSTIIDNTIPPTSKSIEITYNKTQPQSPSIVMKQLLTNDNDINRPTNGTDQTPSLNKNSVKSMVRQFNTNALSHPTVSPPMVNQRTCRRISFQPTTFISKNIV